MSLLLQIMLGSADLRKTKALNLYFGKGVDILRISYVTHFLPGYIPFSVI